MIKVKNQNGIVVPGLYKDNLGTIAVKNDAEYLKYKREKNQLETINNLTKEISDLKIMVESLSQSITNVNNHVTNKKKQTFK